MFFNILILYNILYYIKWLPKCCVTNMIYPIFLSHNIWKTINLLISTKRIFPPACKIIYGNWLFIVSKRIKHILWHIKNRTAHILYTIYNIHIINKVYTKRSKLWCCRSPTGFDNSVIVNVDGKHKKRPASNIYMRTSEYNIIQRSARVNKGGHVRINFGGSNASAVW